MADLTTSASIQEYMGNRYDGSQSAAISTLITQVSDSVEKILGYTVAASDYKEWLDGSGTHWLATDTIPINNIDRVAMGRVNALMAQCDVTNLTHASVRVDSSNVTLRRTVAGTDTTNELAVETYTVITDMADAVTAVTGWTGTVRGSYDQYPTSNLRPIEAVPAHKPHTAYLELPSEEMDDVVIIKPSAGLLYSKTGFPKGMENIFIEYNGGYSSTPAGLKRVVNKMVVEALDISARDTSLRIHRLGDESWTANTVESIVRDNMGELAPWIHYKGRVA